MDLVFLSVCLLQSVFFASGFHTGAPDQACSTMIPGHGPPPQTGQSPFRLLIPTATSDVKSGEPVDITISAPTAGPAFKGFLIQVRARGGSEAVGEFQPDSDPSNAQPVACFGKANSAMTHKINDTKAQVKLRWTPPANSDTVEYEPIMTVVLQQDTFWVKEKGPTIKVQGGKSSSGSPSSSSAENNEVTRDTEANSSDPNPPSHAAAVTHSITITQAQNSWYTYSDD
ncbi:unnamed protein product [Orchesella dallaii]|uniref:Reelin domain-containing protein n=1 Tax=Orchesella dallaii TaxID=48710 RepID=A0ABP1RRE1_9HEXA